ncbi:MAG: hypothetical protein H7Z39_10545 [Burkholderiaceae bacterium]|nr:hypothetical protein [Burkholderiaceae bacterium]
MSTEKKAPRAKQDFTQCPDWGQGGKFIFDPATGQRTRVGESAVPAAEAAPGEAQALLAQADAGAAGVDQPVIAENATPRKEKARG